MTDPFKFNYFNKNLLLTKINFIYIYISYSYDTDVTSISNQLSNSGMNSIYSIINKLSDGSIILQNKQIREDTIGSFIKLTDNLAIEGRCGQGTKCSTNPNIMKLLIFSNFADNLFPGSWTSFCPAFFFYGSTCSARCSITNEPKKLTTTIKPITTKPTTKPTTKKRT